MALPYLPPKNIKTEFNYKDLHITKPETLTGVSQQEAFRGSGVCTLFFTIVEGAYISYEFSPIHHQHGMERPEITAGWEGIVIQKT
jgi:hypothetical protein